MSDFLAVVIFEHLSQKVEDRCMNTFTFHGAGSAPTTPELDDATLALIQFYNAVDSVTSHTVAHYLSTSLDRGSLASHIEYFDITAHLAGTPHGSPIRIDQWTLGGANPGATSLPAELSIAMSFHGDLSALSEESGSTRPRSRRRGRVYLGPLTTPTLENESPTNRCRVATQCRNTIATAGGLLMADTDTDWRVWSRASAATAVVIGGHVDDAFDIQRRRGEDAVARTIWP